MKLLLLAQASASLATAPVPDQRFDLKSAIDPSACQAGDGEEIVVCAKKRDDMRYRLAPADRFGPRFEEKPFKAETDVFGGSASLGVAGETVTIGGSPSNRLMIRLKTKF